MIDFTKMPNPMNKKKGETKYESEGEKLVHGVSNYDCAIK